MNEPRVRQRRKHVRGEVEKHVGRSEDERDRLHDREITLGDAVDHQLAEARVDEDHLDHDHAGDFIPGIANRVGAGQDLTTRSDPLPELADGEFASAQHILEECPVVDEKGLEGMGAGKDLAAGIGGEVLCTVF